MSEALEERAQPVQPLVAATDDDTAAAPDPRELLQTERADAVARIAALERELGVIVDASVAVAVDDEHDPEGATIAFERSQVAALLDQAREGLAGLDAALRRLDEGTYGVCQRCGRDIAPARLVARPAATLCIECAAARP
ncbi:MAG TPA: TraR/DksA C4-type zinc finger protein [Motilibacteraceae bacterium]|nr:TraR/DksA C4-type zinc finger protein [Motilibacteraceae bacterium]